MMVETWAGLFGCMPFAALALTSAMVFRHAMAESRRALAMNAAIAMTGLLLALGVSAFAATSIRFTLDFSMPLLVSAGLAWTCLDAALDGRRLLRFLLRSACVAAVAYGMTVNLAIGLTGLFDWLRRGEPATYDRLESAFAPVQRAALALRAYRYGDAVLTLRLPADRNGATEVILAVGARFRHDALCMRYVEGERVTLRFEHRGFPAIRSVPIAAPRGETHTLEVAMGSLYPLNARALARLAPALAAQGVDRVLRVRFDGQEVLSGTFDFVPSPPEAVVFGRDPWGNGICSEPFTGELLSVRRGFPGP